MEKEIKKAAKEYAKKVLGIEQYKNNKDAVKSIIQDFISGANYIIIKYGK